MKRINNHEGGKHLWIMHMLHITLIIKHLNIIIQLDCRNPSLGLATKARACKSAGQKGGLGSTSYIPGSARECERMSPHTPK